MTRNDVSKKIAKKQNLPMTIGQNSDLQKIVVKGSNPSAAILIVNDLRKSSRSVQT